MQPECQGEIDRCAQERTRHARGSPSCWTCNKGILDREMLRWPGIEARCATPANLRDRKCGWAGAPNQRKFVARNHPTPGGFPLRCESVERCNPDSWILSQSCR